MSQANTSDRSQSIYRQLCQRCAELGMALWHCDAAGNVVIEPAEPKHPRQSIELAAKAMCQAPQPLPLEIAKSDWLIPVEDKQAGRRTAMNVALLSSAAAADVQRFAVILRWSCEELARSESDGRTIEQFSEKLSQAYEETNLLYHMARLLNRAVDSPQSIQTIATQLQEVLPFGWLAIRFSGRTASVPELAGKMIVAGGGPCDSQQLQQLSEPLLKRTDPKQWDRLLDAQHPLVQATGAEVVANPITHDGRVIGMLLAGNKFGAEPQVSSFETQFLDATADFLGVFHENLARFAEQQELFLGTLRALTASIDAKDRYTCGHSERVGLLSGQLAAALGFDKQLVEQYRIAGLVHDVGKIGVPEAVLCKPGRLTDSEFAQIKLHPEIGHTILKDIPAMEPLLPGVLWHHERWDGRGYPHGKAAQDIPMIARVLALADTFDAMSSNRSYRPAQPRSKVLEEIRRCAGSQFDAALVPAFVSLDFAEYDRAVCRAQTAQAA